MKALFNNMILFFCRRLLKSTNWAWLDLLFLVLFYSFALVSVVMLCAIGGITEVLFALFFAVLAVMSFFALFAVMEAESFYALHKKTS